MSVKKLYKGNRTGSSKFSVLLLILIVVVVFFMGVNIVPVYIHNYEIQNLFAINANRAATTPLKSIKLDITNKLVTMHAPITINNVRIIENSPQNITISADYSVVVKFVDDYKITFRFKPKARTNT